MYKIQQKIMLSIALVGTTPAQAMAPNTPYATLQSAKQFIRIKNILTAAKISGPLSSSFLMTHRKNILPEWSHEQSSPNYTSKRPLTTLQQLTAFTKEATE